MTSNSILAGALAVGILAGITACKSSNDTVTVLSPGTVAVGMSEQEVIAAWGQPEQVTDERPNGLDNLLWDYGVTQYVGFDYRVKFASGEVTGILVTPGQPQGGRWVESWTK